MSTMTIVQLYPDELGVSGDSGNVVALTARLAAADIESEVVEVGVGDALPASADIVIIGGGPLSAVRGVQSDLLAKGDLLRAWADDGVVFFSYGSGAELLGREIVTVDGERIAGVGIFPLEVRRVSARKVGYVVADARGHRVVGFEDNASEWSVDADSTPFARVTVSSTVNAQSAHDGIRVGASIATLLGGPLLPLNPSITLELIEAAASRRGIELVRPVGGVLDDYAEHARAVMEQNAAHVFSRI